MCLYVVCHKKKNQGFVAKNLGTGGHQKTLYEYVTIHGIVTKLVCGQLTAPSRNPLSII